MLCPAAAAGQSTRPRILHVVDGSDPFPLEQIRTAFHYVAAGHTHEVEEHPSREEIATMIEG